MFSQRRRPLSVAEPSLARRASAEILGTAFLLISIVAAIWYSSSTGFANPAVTVVRALTDTFMGIPPPDVLPFMAAQFAGAAVATFLFRWLVSALPSIADEVVLPHYGDGIHP